MTDNALIAAEEFSAADLTKFLQQSGWAEKPAGDVVQRLKFSGNSISTPDGDMFVYNASKPKIPALTVRIVKPPEEYWAIYISESNANVLGRPEFANTFSKSYVHPDPARRIWDSDAAFDQIKAAGLMDEYGRDIKPSWKADIQVQIMPESGMLTGDEPVYTLTLPTTSLVEFKGSYKDPDAGSVSPKNFIHKLCDFAMENDPKNPKQAVIQALTSLTLGGVVAEVRLLPAENKELNRNWTVVSFDPIHVEPMMDGDLLVGSGDAEAGE